MFKINGRRRVYRGACYSDRFGGWMGGILILVFTTSQANIYLLFLEFELKTTLNLYCVYMYFNIDWNELEVYNGMLIYTQFVGLVSPLLVFLKDQTKTQFFTLIFFFTIQASVHVSTR